MITLTSHVPTAAFSYFKRKSSFSTELTIVDVRRASSSTGPQSQVSLPRSALRLAKYPLFRRLSYLAGPLPNLGHDERLAQGIEHSVDVCLTLTFFRT